MVLNTIYDTTGICKEGINDLSSFWIIFNTIQVHSKLVSKTSKKLQAAQLMTSKKLF